MYRIFLTGITVLVCCTALFSQDETDALRYSRIGFGGDARYCSMGGAFGALGADLSSFNVNPAGLGFYHKNEIAISPSLFSQNISSNYNGTASNGYKSNFRVDNFGFVFSGKTDNTSESGWQNVAMGITYNRESSFQANYDMKGVGTGSMMDSWAQIAGGNSPSELDQFSQGLAWNTYLLNNVQGDSTHYVSLDPHGDAIQREKTVSETGGMGEWLFGIGGNYSNKLYVGGSIGISQVRFGQSTTYTEKEVVDSTSSFDFLQYNQSLTTVGRGFNFKAGVIYRPIDLLRLGLSFSSPTVLKLTDSYSASMSSIVANVPYTYSSPDGSFNYTIRTPMHLTGSAAVVVEKIGLISVDYETVNYSRASINAATYSFSDANAAIKSKYTLAQNIRVGGEIRFLPWAFRAGFAYYGSPYAVGVDNSATKIYITGGVGYRDPNDKFFIDLGIVTSAEKSNYFFYDPDYVNPVKNVSKIVTGIITFGLRY